MLRRWIGGLFSLHGSNGKELPPGSIQVRPSLREGGDGSRSVTTNWNRVSTPEEMSIKAHTVQLLGPTAAAIALERLCPEGPLRLLSCLEEEGGVTREEACMRIARMAADSFMESTQGRASLQTVMEEKESMDPEKQGIVCEENVTGFPAEWGMSDGGDPSAGGDGDG